MLKIIKPLFSTVRREMSIVLKTIGQHSEPALTAIPVRLEAESSSLTKRRMRRTERRLRREFLSPAMKTNWF
mgnify:CR=1 FL=1